jgi:hypothetical protein
LDADWVSERRYYKLLPLFAQKVNGRYVLDQVDVVTRMKAHLDHADRCRAVPRPAACGCRPLRSGRYLETGLWSGDGGPDGRAGE